MQTHRRKRGKGGRPRGAPGQLRGQSLGVCVNPVEMDAIRRKADSVGLPVSQWLRQIALARYVPRPLVPELNREVYAELAKLAGNLNQLARAASAAEDRVLVPMALLKEVYAILQQLRLELLGAESDRQAG